MNKNNKNMMIRAKNSAIAKLCCRMLGEEAGQAMMEYVIIAVLIAAAAAVGIWYFGRNITNETHVAEHAMHGDVKGARQDQDSTVQKMSGEANAVKGQQHRFIKTDGAQSGNDIQ